MLMESTKNATTHCYEFVVTTNIENKNAMTRLQKKYPIVPAFETESLGCVRGFNLSFQNASGKYIVHVNDDAEFCAGAIDNMLNAIGDRDALGAFYYTTPLEQEFHVNYLFGKLYANFGCIKKSLMERLGWWDEKTYAHYGADPDFAMKCWGAGCEVVGVPDAKIIHHEIHDGIRKEGLRSTDSSKLQSKWRDIFC